MSKRKTTSTTASGSKASKSERALQLASLGRDSYASKSAIEKLLAHIDRHGLPETYDRNAQYRARKEICRNPESTEYGPLVTDVQATLIDGSVQRFSMQNVFAWLQYACLNSPHYGKIVQDALDRYPCTPSSPWRLILYQDGVDPSDGLAKNHSRKSAVYYFAFVEFGYQALAKEECWGVVTVARYSEYTQLAGKSASLFKLVLDQFFGETHHLRRTGCALRFPNGKRALLLADLSVLLADHPALAECLLCKTHSGLMCCPLCVNCTQENSSSHAGPLHEYTAAAVSISETNWSLFVKHTNDSIRQVIRTLRDSKQLVQDGALRADDFEELEIIKGWNWHPILEQTILNDRFNLSVASILMYDAAHITVHDGICDNELGQMMKVFHSSRSETSYAELGAYVKSFTQPSCAPSLDHLFTPAANKNNNKNASFSCTGSEFLTLAPLLSRYLRNIVVPRGEFLDHAMSMLAVLDVLELIQAVKTGTVEHSTLRKAIVKHLKLYKACYGANAFRPKHHYALHLAYMLKGFGFLLQTFTHERKHRLVTRYTRDRRNLRSWDAGAIEEITCHSLFELSQPFWGCCKAAKARGAILIPLRELFPGVYDDNFTMLNSVSGNGGNINAGDVVSCIFNGHMHIGQLLVAVGIQPACTAFAIVSLWQRHPDCKDAIWSNYLVSRDNVVKLPLEHLDTVFTHAMSADRSSCVVYMPVEVRPK